MVARDPAKRARYLDLAWRQVERLLGAIDRNPYHATYGCLDRQFWHYRTASFPSEMYQEGVLALALAYHHALPGNIWHGEPRLRELAIAALRFSARSCHPDGSCDDYYPFERALGAAVFSLQAAAEAAHLLEVDDREVTNWLVKRARWVADHDETGRLANHHALAALGLARLARLTGKREFAEAGEEAMRRVLSWQASSGWFAEYGGADPGYQTVTIDALATYQQLSGPAWLSEPLARAVDFARWFLHPDSSYGGEYGSRGTYHFYPHGMELLAAHHGAAAELAEGFLNSVGQRTAASFDDDRMFAHRTANFIQAYLAWQPKAAPAAPLPESTRTFADAGLIVSRGQNHQAVVSVARGGVIKHFGAASHTDAGWVIETAGGRVAVSNAHELPAVAEVKDSDEQLVIRVVRQLTWARHETATPLRQAVLHLGMITLGRFCRSLVRRLLQRRLITGRRLAGIELTRTLTLTKVGADAGRWRILDCLRLLDRRLTVQSMSIGTDHEPAYIAATGVYQRSVLEPWWERNDLVESLNRDRYVEVERTLD